MKRGLLILLLLAVGGAIVNVAVAWAISWHKPMLFMFAGGGMLVWEGPTIWTTFVDVDHGAVVVWAEPRPFSPRPGSSTIPVGKVPHWSHASLLTSTDLEDGVCLLEQARGYPCISLLWRRYDQSRQVGSIRGGIPIASSSERALPLIPIWPGFAINTVFYAVVLWLLFAAPFVVRRRRRIRRGLCPKCAYDLRGTHASVCPECGATK